MQTTGKFFDDQIGHLYTVAAQQSMANSLFASTVFTLIEIAVPRATKAAGWTKEAKEWLVKFLKLHTRPPRSRRCVTVMYRTIHELQQPLQTFVQGFCFFFVFANFLEFQFRFLLIYVIPQPRVKVPVCVCVCECRCVWQIGKKWLSSFTSHRTIGDVCRERGGKAKHFKRRPPEERVPLSRVSGC